MQDFLQMASLFQGLQTTMEHMGDAIVQDERRSSALLRSLKLAMVSLALARLVHEYQVIYRLAKLTE